MRHLRANTPARPAKGRRKTAPRRRAPPRLNRRRAGLTGIAALAIVTLAGAAWLWHSGWVGRQVDAAVDAAYALTADAGFAVEDVLVEGRARTRRDALLVALRVERGTPILAVDPSEAQARLEALPWVKRASVERRLPRILYLHLIERQPLALWQVDGKVAVIDQDGEVIHGVEEARFAALPLVVGEGANQHAAALLALLEREPDLRTLISAAVRVGGRRWNLRLSDGIDVRLPEHGAAKAWSHFARLEREHGLLQRDVIAIDLRLPDRLVVRTAPGATISDDEAKKGRNT